jgi:hypothetical protein
VSSFLPGEIFHEIYLYGPGSFGGYRLSRHILMHMVKAPLEVFPLALYGDSSNAGFVYGDRNAH